MKSARALKAVFSLLLFLLISPLRSQDGGMTAGKDAKNILPLRRQLKIMEECLAWRLDNIIPVLMRREGIDMWLTISSGEYARDPIGPSLFGANGISSGGTGTVVFHDRGPELGVERFSTGRGGLYKSLPADSKVDPFENLAKFIRERNPKKIGINTSKTKYWSFADGISATSKERLVAALGTEYSSRLVSAERLCVGWLETRSPQELSLYRHICGVAHDLIAEYFSNKVIIPDVTTTDEACSWLGQKFVELGLGSWFGTYITTQRYADGKVKFLRSGSPGSGNENVIRRGDLIHCDVGIVYLGLCTDNQQNAYVCRIGENDAPEGLKEALRRANRVQDISMNEFQEGKTGNDVFLVSLEKTKKEELNASIYTHPLGYHGHAAGPFIGFISRQEPTPGVGEYPIYLNTCYSIELHVMTKVPEWGNQEVRMALEEDSVFAIDGCKFIDGRQTRLFLIH